jgi:hypothetical protein
LILFQEENTPYGSSYQIAPEIVAATLKWTIIQKFCVEKNERWVVRLIKLKLVKNLANLGAGGS